MEEEGVGLFGHGRRSFEANWKQHILQMARGSSSTADLECQGIRTFETGLNCSVAVTSGWWSLGFRGIGKGKTLSKWFFCMETIFFFSSSSKWLLLLWLLYTTLNDD